MTSLWYRSKNKLTGYSSPVETREDVLVSDSSELNEKGTNIMTTPVEIMWLDNANKICSIICLVRLQQTQHQGLNAT